MREVRTLDHWRRVYERRYQTALRSVEYQSLRGLGDGRLMISGGITVICGPNGSGKSTLLQAIFLTLSDSADSVLPGYRKKLTVGGMVADILIGENAVRLERNFGDQEQPYKPPVELSVTWLEPAVESPYLLRHFIEMPNLEDLLAPLESAIASETERQLLSYVVGKDYEKVEVYEIDGIFGRDVVPYFRVVSHGVSYGAESMGLGEFSIFLMLWVTRNSQRDGILLIEEPEAFISPRSQEALLNYLAKSSVENGIMTIITTHSPSVLKMVPEKHIAVLVRSQEKGRLFEPQSSSDYLIPLGLSPQKKALIFVEDLVARAHLSGLLSALAPELITVTDIVHAGGATEVVRAVKALPDNCGWLRYLGVLDGDMRLRSKELGIADVDAIEFLPGELAPDALLRATVISNLDKASECLGVQLNWFRSVIVGLEGADVHDWLCRLGKNTGRQLETLVSQLTGLWLSLPDNRISAQRVVADIARRLDAND